jgi:hypothetical protein
LAGTELATFPEHRRNRRPKLGLGIPVRISVVVLGRPASRHGSGSAPIAASWHVLVSQLSSLGIPVGLDAARNAGNRGPDLRSTTRGVVDSIRGGAVGIFARKDKAEKLKSKEAEVESKEAKIESKKHRLESKEHRLDGKEETLEAKEERLEDKERELEGD